MTETSASICLLQATTPAVEIGEPSLFFSTLLVDLHQAHLSVPFTIGELVVNKEIFSYVCTV